MTLTIPEVLGVLGLAFTVVAFIWRRLDTVSEAMRKENREAHDRITTRIDGLREHMDVKFEGFGARNAAIEKEAAFTRGEAGGAGPGRRSIRCLGAGPAGGDAMTLTVRRLSDARCRWRASDVKRKRRQGADMRKNRRVVAVLVLAAVFASAPPVRAQEQETVFGGGSTEKVPYFVAKVPFQLYETPPVPVPIFRFLLSPPDEKDLIMVRGTNFLVLERRVVNRLGERSLWWHVQSMQQSEHLTGWIYAGSEPEGGVNDPNSWWSLGGVVDAAGAGLKISKSTDR